MQTQKHLFTTKKLKSVIRGLNQRRQTMQWSKEKKDKGTNNGIQNTTQKTNIK